MDPRVGTEPGLEVPGLFLLEELGYKTHGIVFIAEIHRPPDAGPHAGGQHSAFKAVQAECAFSD